MKSFYFKLFFCHITSFFLFSILILATSATGLSLRPPDEYTNFEPGKVVSVGYKIGNTDKDIKVDATSPFGNDIKISQITKQDQIYTFTVNFTLPQTTTLYGSQEMRVTVTEKLKNPRMIGTLIGLTGLIFVEVPYPGLYLQADLTVADVNIDETAYIDINVWNRGSINISEVSAVAEVSSGDKKLATLETEKVSLPVTNSYTLSAPFETKGLKPGLYTVNATVTYDGNNKIQKSTEFRIGTKDLKLINYTKEFIQGKINKFDFLIESGWNNPLEEVYVIAYIEREGKSVAQIKTPTFSINPWERVAVTAYWDTGGIDIGEYLVSFIINFDENKVTQEGTITVIPPIAQKEPTEEKPKKGISTLTIILIIVILTLIAVNLYFIVFKRKKEKEEDEDDF
jgi:hypothetical protein